MRYRRWLKNEIFCLIAETKKMASYTEAELLVFMIDGAILRLLISDKIEEQTKLLDYYDEGNLTLIATQAIELGFYTPNIVISSCFKQKLSENINPIR